MNDALPSPYETGFFDCGAGHRLYYERYGNKNGIDAVYLHGGPGAGMSPQISSMFCLDKYNLLLFDQRGAGKSEPYASTEHNNISTLIDDVENLRVFFGIKKWLVCGGSWGSSLAMFYAERYQAHVSGLLLVGIFFSDQRGVRWLCEENGASEIRPEYFKPYKEFAPKERRNELVLYYYDTLKEASKEVQNHIYRLFNLWDTSILHYHLRQDKMDEIETYPERFEALTKIFYHFAVHEYKDENRAFLLSAMGRSKDIPMAIIHGRYDLICPVANAFVLHEAASHSILHIAEDAGHTCTEPSLFKACADFLEIFARQSNFKE